LLDRLTRAPRELGSIIATRLTATFLVRRSESAAHFSTACRRCRRVLHGFVHRARRRTRASRALKVSLKVPAERERALVGALRDDDPRTVRLALTAALDDWPAPALPLVTQIAVDPTAGSELRVLAIKVLSRVRNTAALSALIQIVDGGTSWLGRAKLARGRGAPRRVMALAAGWPNDMKATALLALAAASRSRSAQRRQSEAAHHRGDQAMSGDPVRFLNAFAQSLAAMALYRVGHPARERALDVAYQQIQDLQGDTARPLFTFLGDEVVFGNIPCES